MSSLLEKCYGLTRKKANETVTSDTLEKHSANCNICRNFANILDRSHRLSTSHQDKLSERLKTIRSKMKMVNVNSIAVHDEEWGKNDDLWCYFCDKSVEKHQVFEGLTVVYLGYLTHLSDSDHKEAVKSYLKYHGRNESFELYCKTKADLEKYLNKIPQAKEKYLAKLNFLHRKDVAHIKEIEEQRQALISEAAVSTIIKRDMAARYGKKVHAQQTNTNSTKNPFKQNAKSLLNEKPKICPWMIQPEKDHIHQQVPEKPVIGPTIDTLKKHVADQKKKMLPLKRLGANFQRKQVYSSNWLPSFSGVWNKGRHRQMKSNGKQSG